MSTHTVFRLLGVLAVGGAVTLGPRLATAQERPATAEDTAPAFAIDGRIALHSLMSLSDAHLQKLADVLAILAKTESVRTGEWKNIRESLSEASRVNVPAAFWFASPTGSYWSLTQGRVEAKLTDRPYFSRVLAGQTVIGDLVVSRSTNRNTAIVAVPVRGRNNTVVGLLGASVYLDSLSVLIRHEMGGLTEGLIFFAIDSAPLGALNSDPSLIFTEPMKLGDEGMQQAFKEMLSDVSGVVTYDFHGARRTVLYRKSPVTGWWYGFGAARR
jgi:hypothetical protein